MDGINRGVDTIRWLGLALTLASAMLLLFSGTAMAYEHRALILVDEMPGGQPATTQVTLENLLGHFSLPSDVELLDDYQAGDIDGYRVTFYIGSVWDRELPPAFMADVMATGNRVVWINYNIWRLEWSAYEQAFQDRYGFTFIESRSTGVYNQVSYRGRSFSRLQSDFGQTQVLDAGKAAVLASITGGAGSFPYIIRSGNFYYVADDPAAWVSEVSGYLVFTDLLHDMVGIDHPEEHRALVRIEDIDPTEDPARIRAIADYLYGEGIPFSLGVVPRFEDPLGAWGAPTSLGLSDRPELVSALQYAVGRGGTIVLHGYTHQYGAVANPYNGVTGADSEFYIQELDGSGDPVNVGPVPEDSIPWVNGRIDSALAELDSAGFPAPLVWETPHYLASDLDNQVFAGRFGVVYQRFADAYFPYIIEQSVFGSRVIPEDLGYIGATTPPEMIIDRADRELVVRDGFASFFFHSEKDIALLSQAVTGLEAQRYDFVSVDSLITPAPADTAPPLVNSVTPAGTIYSLPGAVSVTFDDSGAGIDLLSVTVTLDGNELSGCVVTVGGATCPAGVTGTGDHDIGGSVGDNAGNTAPISGGFFVGDNTAPQVSYSGPMVALAGADVTVTAGYDDPGLSLGVDEGSATVSLNGGPPQACDAAGGSIDCLLTGLADGYYSAEVTILDNAGNPGGDTGSFSVDTVAPVIISPLPEGWIGVTETVITAQVEEANPGADPAWLFLDGGAPVACSVDGGIISCPVSGLAQGAHSFLIDVYDSALNSGSAAGQFAVDSEAPQVTITAPQGLIESSGVTIEADLADSGSGVDPSSVQVRVDGVPVVCTAAAGHVSCPVSGLLNGDHTIDIDAADFIGNSLTSHGDFQTLFCAGEAPSLELAIGGPSWASYPDYQQRLLAVDYLISNASGPDASDVRVAGSKNTNGVILVSSSLDGISLAAGGQEAFILKYVVPHGVSSFRTATSVTAMDDCGNPFTYPDSRPGQ